MTRHRTLNCWLAAFAFAATWMLLIAALDGPSDLQALQDTAASVQDAQAAAATTAHTTQLAMEQP